VTLDKVKLSVTEQASTAPWNNNVCHIMHKAISELEKIIVNMNGIERKELFEDWKEKWLSSSEVTQLVINKSVMSIEEHDFTCEYIAKKCLEDLLDKGCFSFDIDKNCYRAEIWSLKNEKPKKIKKSGKVF